MIISVRCGYRSVGSCSRIVAATSATSAEVADDRLASCSTKP